MSDLTSAMGSALTAFVVRRTFSAFDHLMERYKRPPVADRAARDNAVARGNSHAAPRD